MLRPDSLRESLVISPDVATAHVAAVRDVRLYHVLLVAFCLNLPAASPMSSDERSSISAMLGVDPRMNANLICVNVR